MIVPTRRPTLHDVAAEAGVSIKTVSRVVNGSEQVSADLRTRVEAVVDRLHYVPNTLARNLKVGSGDTIGVVIDTIADPFFAALTHAVEERALEAGLNVVFGSTGFTPARERRQVERLAMQQVRALLLAPTEGSHDYLARFDGSFPIVVIDRPVEGERRYDTVRVADRAVARQAVAHLAAHGHRRIAFVGSDERYQTTRDRLDGYHDALTAGGIDTDATLVRPGPTRDVDAAEVTADLLALEHPPTAIFAANPRASIGVAHVLHTRDRSDVAFVSFGDFPLARTLRPAVTYVDQNPAHIGLAAVERVLARIDGDASSAQDVLVEATLVPRGSGEIEVTA